MSQSKSGDPRLGSLLVSEESDQKLSCKCVIAIIGYPCDEGVRLNSGRLGSSSGPFELRRRLWLTGTVNNPELEIDLASKLAVVDLGDVYFEGSLEKVHKNLQDKVQEALVRTFCPIVIGGGNDQSYPNAKALLTTLGKNSGICVVNIDAHLDVRPLIDGKLAHSGSPFYQLLLDEQFRTTSSKFVEFAAQGSQCSKEHANFVKQNGGEIQWLSQLKNDGVVKRFRQLLDYFEETNKPIFVSFDIDSIQSSDCPGVSCPSVIGLTAEEAIDIAFAAGNSKHVVLVDFSEFNPAIENDRTTRLLSQLIYNFCLGRVASC